MRLHKFIDQEMIYDVAAFNSRTPGGHPEGYLLLPIYTRILL
jgi:hypothetical protein